MEVTHRRRRRRKPRGNKISQPFEDPENVPASSPIVSPTPSTTSISIPETNLETPRQNEIDDIPVLVVVQESGPPAPTPHPHESTNSSYHPNQTDHLVEPLVKMQKEERLQEPFLEQIGKPIIEPMVNPPVVPTSELIPEPPLTRAVEPIVETLVEPMVEHIVEPDTVGPQEDKLTMPETLTHLKTSNGNEVYLLGTAHFSKRSVDDVKKLMRTLRPSLVVLELCKERAFMLTLDEQSLLEENKKLSFDMIKNAIATKGLAQGLIYIMFIKMSASLTENLGLAPGSEFRTGSAEAQLIPGCGVFLGDRPLSITIARAVASINIWQKMKLIYQVLTSDTIITQEDVENCRNKDIIEQLLEELGVQYPGFKQVILDERNVYLAHTIYQWAKRIDNRAGPSKVVAIVGIGHVSGIVENWGKTSDSDLLALSEIPKVSKTRRVVTKTIKYCSIVLVLYFGYRVITPSSIQSAIQDKILNRVATRPE